jgi:hypothetical protein
MIGGPQSRSGHYGEQNILGSIGSRIPTLRWSSRYTNYAIPALTCLVLGGTILSSSMFPNTPHLGWPRFETGLSNLGSVVDKAALV